MKSVFFFLFSFCFLFSEKIMAQSAPAKFRIIGYYSGPTNAIDSFEIEQLTHLIFCFGHLEGNTFHIGSKEDSATIQRMVELKKKRNPKMKVMLSLGGWSGCKTCSDVFNTEKGRVAFATSVQEISHYFHTDGIDIDWEYPVVKGFPGHTFRMEDRENLTALLKEIRLANGKDFELSFAAGGFTNYIDSSIDWKSVVRYTSFVNVMSYDLVHGYSKFSGHHTPLYATPQQKESTDNAVRMMLKAGVPSHQIIIGAAFYGRYFKIEEGHDVGLYQPAFFDHGFSWKHQEDSLAKNGFTINWDSVAQAPFAINKQRRLLATYDDEQSIELKTRYAQKHHLGGIMFWQLGDDKKRKGLLEVMYKNR
jgi:chitinase